MRLADSAPSVSCSVQWGHDACGLHEQLTHAYCCPTQNLCYSSNQRPRMHASWSAHACHAGSLHTASAGSSAVPLRALPAAPAASYKQPMRRIRYQRVPPCAYVSCSAIAVSAQSALQRSRAFSHHPCPGNTSSSSSHTWTHRKAVDGTNHCHARTLPAHNVPRSQRTRLHSAPVQIISPSDIPVHLDAQPTLRPSLNGSSGKVLMPQVFIGAAGVRSTTLLHT